MITIDVQQTKPITVLGKGSEDSDIEGYTIFKNHDEELVKKIKSVKLSEDSFEYEGFMNGIFGTCKIEKEIDGQLQCIGPKNKRFFLDPEEYKEIRERELLNKINRLYPVSDYFNDNFGNVIGETKIKVITLDKEANYNALDKVMAIESELEISDYNENIFSVSFSEGRGGSIMFCHFDINGNYVNRDYNVDIVEMSKTKPTTKKQILNKAQKYINNPTYTYFDNTWYCEDYAMRINIIDESEQEREENSFVDGSVGFSIQKYPYNSNSKKYGKSYDKVKKPKEGIIHTKKDILEQIQPIINKMNLPE